MTITVRDSELANGNTSIDQAVATSTSQSFATTSLNTSFPPSSTTLSTSSGVTTSRTDGVSASTNAISASPTVATAHAAVTSTSSNDIVWGPAITASPMPNADLSIDQTSSHEDQGFSEGAKQVTIATTVIGGVFIIALLVYAVYQRRRGATFSEIARFRHHYPSTIGFNPTPRDARLTALPIYRETRYSVRSSQHASLASFHNPARYTAPRQPPQPLPREVTQKFHLQNPYVRNLWKTAHPTSVPGTPLRETHSAMEDETAPVRKPEKARFASYRLSGRSFVTQQSIAETAKSSPKSSFTERPLSKASAVPPTPPDTPYSRRNLRDHWSWTNSQAPATPRMYAPSSRSSISTLPRFRNVTSWVRGQNHRVDKVQPAAELPREKRPILKNKASLPRLAPPPVTRKLTRARAEQVRIGSLSSIVLPRPEQEALSP
ncbi:hypothetical protein LTR91_010175 [Friedmanniomyces endolithicus]|uniref:Uncharacterized protein n=1 Tax=Friedmanniomyces endolithicus TaxID=329885 RepID=A0AAN6QSH3_9PEZI|nr:hypothetical protein LTR82_010683 [Friedmanniomyces endolithicus]KAK0927534.1 hypothetical protein LTR57_003255 [Friedmanniomyces endolithicus]KAK0982058.1 hypothetical protein LTR54_014847 [Friedmanniomyces endolithicus]KAK0986460.1 hypothetical protein LTR91_010175 [Friedmanniomyces endolithicus]KAK1007989.1 hypothetical protein LTS01_002487 [Friedmanniomyces endolithicus]